ncbi:MAG: hypothetical protein K2X76_01650 [Sphingomonas sp.]|nr:hypothetical protein [Sphingomonas sp.]
MTRISQADQILLMLREQLQRSEARRGGAPARAQRRGPPSPPPLERARALAALDALGEDERRRHVLHAVLSQRIGERVSNDPAFGHLVDRVLAIIMAEPDGPALIDRALAELRGG